MALSNPLRRSVIGVHRKKICFRDEHIRNSGERLAIHTVVRSIVDRLPREMRLGKPEQPALAGVLAGSLPELFGSAE